MRAGCWDASCHFLTSSLLFPFSNKLCSNRSGLVFRCAALSLPLRFLACDSGESNICLQSVIVNVHQCSPPCSGPLKEQTLIITICFQPPFRSRLVAPLNIEGGSKIGAD